MSGPRLLPYPPFFDWSRAVDARDYPLGLTRGVTHDEETGLPYPEPTTPEPREAELRDMLFDGSCPATDGCEVEPDGTCPHGHPAWPRRMGLI